MDNENPVAAAVAKAHDLMNQLPVEVSGVDGLVRAHRAIDLAGTVAPPASAPHDIIDLAGMFILGYDASDPAVHAEAARIAREHAEAGI